MSHIHDLSTVTITPEALDEIPESVARESCILPVSVSQASLHVILPVDVDQSDVVTKLRFILNRPITFDTADRAAIVAVLDKYYPTSKELAEGVVLPETLPPFEAQSEVAFLDFVGQVKFSTASSISFYLGKKSSYLEFSNGVRHRMGKDRVFIVVGWLDVHYPCNGFHKLQVRCCLPGDYVAFEPMRDLIRQVCQALGLPEKVPYRIHLGAAGMSTSMEDPPEGFVCTTQWIPPGESE